LYFTSLVGHKFYSLAWRAGCAEQLQASVLHFC